MNELFYSGNGVAILDLDFENETCETLCGDFYYDYSISFDDIIKIADYIKTRRKHEGAYQRREN